MNREKVHNTIDKIDSYINSMNIPSTRVLSAIEKCKIPQWLKALLQWVAAKTLKKVNVISFLKVYVTVGGALLITRPSLWLWLIKHTIGNENMVGKALSAVVEYIDGTVDYVIFWGLTAVVVLALVFDLIVRLYQRNIKTELRELIDSLTFNPQDGWFDSKCNISISKLGNRYSASANFQNPQLSNIYKALVQPDKWDLSFKRVLQSFLRECTTMCEKWPQSVSSKRSEVEDMVKKITHIYDTHTYGQYATLFELTSRIVDEFQRQYYSGNDIVRLYDLHKLEECYYLLNDHKEICQFTSHPVLYIKGDAGTGKSHMLADIVCKRMARGLKSILLLGLDFHNSCDIKERMLSILGVKGTWDDFLNKLNRIAEIEGQKILIILDGINEGAGARIWSSVIGGIETDILQYQHLGLIVSARTFSGTNLLDSISNNKATLTLNGFRGMEDEALTYLSGVMGITLPNISNYRKEFSNPLFLKLYCKASVTSNNLRPSSFLDIARNYISSVNKTLAIKYGYEASLYNYVQKVADLLCTNYLTQTNTSFIKPQVFDNILDQAKILLPGGIANDFLQSMIDEGVLMNYPDSQGNMLIDFNFDLVGDYLYSEALLNSNFRDYCGRISDSGIYESTSVLVPLTKGVEFFEYNTTNIDFEYRKLLFFRSLKQRFSITASAINEIITIKDTDIDQYYEILPLLTHFDDCATVFEDLNRELKSLSLCVRDQNWSMHFTTRYYPVDDSELFILARWAASLCRNSSRFISDTVSYNMSSLLCWSFSVPYRKLRDIATMAVINLVQDKPLVLNKLINLFNDVDDPYIQQRLFAVVHGAVYKGDSCKSAELAKNIYDKVFNVETVRPDILLRDYAKMSILRISKYMKIEDVDLKKVLPPYSTCFSFSTCPSRETVEEKYRLSEGMGFSDNAVWTQNAILRSMETEYSNGTGGYGDFGRYTFEACTSNWEDCDGYCASQLRNYALDIIFNKYKFDSEIYQIHDVPLDKTMGNRPTMERYGKKFQWIALFETLGALQDNYPMKSSVSNHTNVRCEGSWDPHVRDIDTTNSFWNYYSDGDPITRAEPLEWTHKNTLPYVIKESDKWLTNKEGLSNKIVDDSLEVTDDSGDSWLVLYGYNTMTTDSKKLVVNSEENGLWEFIQAYVVPRNQRDDIANKIYTIGTQGRKLPEYRNGLYNLFYKDYYNSSSYETYADRCQLDKWEKFEGTDLVFQLSYIPYACEQEMSAYRLCKLLFDILQLKDGDRDGEYVDSDGNIIAFDPSISNKNEGQLLIRKDILTETLCQNGYSIVWPLLFEKQRGFGRVGLQIGGYAFIADNGRIKSKLRIYSENRLKPGKSVRQIIVQNAALLIWYTITFNASKKKNVKMRIRYALEHKKRLFS